MTSLPSSSVAVRVMLSAESSTTVPAVALPEPSLLCTGASLSAEIVRTQSSFVAELPSSVQMVLTVMAPTLATSGVPEYTLVPALKLSHPGSAAVLDSVEV